MNWMVTYSLQQQLDLEANHQVTKKETKDNLENGQDYVGIIQTLGVGQTSFKNKIKTYMAHVISTTKGGKV